MPPGGTTAGSHYVGQSVGVVFNENFWFYKEHPLLFWLLMLGVFVSSITLILWLANKYIDVDIK
mgnify:CR=1 FL=1|tara:strand:- start:848 stop:1039 length:192 start_codon:yes stop_codon:yes gene_type:complete